MHTLDVHNGRYFIQISLTFGMLTILLIIKSCTKINQLKLQTQCNLKVAENHEIVDIWPFIRFLMNLGVASRVQNLKIYFINYSTPPFRPITSITELFITRDVIYSQI